MDILPSEIARIVLGYLEDHKCGEAAEKFLETSSELEECRQVLSRGGSFKRHIDKLTLVDIVERYSSIDNLVREKLSKIQECDHRQCLEFLEQLRFLIEGSRNQKFVVNISVPSQKSLTNPNASPIISGSMKKRQRNGNEKDRDRCKRFAKTESQSSGKFTATNDVPVPLNTVETTAIESLPGHIESTKFNAREEPMSLRPRNRENTNSHHAKRNNRELKSCLPDPITGTFQQLNQNLQGKDVQESTQFGDLNTLKECTTSTNTEESSRNYFNTNLQTRIRDSPLDFKRLISEDSMQNLTLLSKELLHRPELHERIADNINKSFVSTEIPMKDDACGANSSLAVINNSDILKSIVQATDADPEFQQFIDACIRPDVDIRENLGDKSRLKSESRFTTCGKQQEPEGNLENDKLGVQAELQCKNSKLENDNAVAIQSIINAKTASSLNVQNEDIQTDPESGIKGHEILTESEISQAGNAKEKTDNMENTPSKMVTHLRSSMKKSVTGVEFRSQSQKPSRRKEVKSVKKSSDETIVKPTWVLCSKNDSGSVRVSTHPVISMDTTAHYVPIVPKCGKNYRDIFCKKMDVVHRIEGNECKSVSSQPELSTVPLFNQKSLPIINTNTTALWNNSHSAAIMGKQTANLIYTQPTPLLDTQSTALLNTQPTVFLNTKSTILANSLPHILPKAQTALSQKGQTIILQGQTALLETGEASNLQMSIPIEIPNNTTLENNKAVIMPAKGFSVIEQIPNKTVESPLPVTISLAVSSTSGQIQNLPIISLPEIQIDESKRNNETETNLKELLDNQNSSKVDSDFQRKFSDNTDNLKDCPATPQAGNKSKTKNSITLYGTENSSPALVEAANDVLPSFSLEDSFSFSLSPYLKIHSSKKKNLSIKDDLLISENVSNNQNLMNLSTTSSIMRKEDLLRKRTPKSLLKSRSKNHRLSLSTPRRRQNHVRGLDFGTPMKFSNDSSDSVKIDSPSAGHNRSKSLCKTSLFKSPPFSNTQAQILESPAKDHLTCKVPIATRSPVPKLMGGWEKYTGMDMILGGLSPNYNNLNSPVIEQIEVESQQSVRQTALKSWDSDLRVGLNHHSEVSNVTKSRKRSKNNKVKSGNRKRKTLIIDQSSKINDKMNQTKNSIENHRPVAVHNTSSSPEGIPPSEGVSSSKESLFPETAKSDLKTVKTVAINCESSGSVIRSKCIDKRNENSERKLKKYAKITTLSRSKVPDSPKHPSKSTNPIDNLETPQKLEFHSGIPPTPRFISPTSNSITPFTKITSQDGDSHKLPNLFPTPEFPPTPNINFTPDHISDNKKDIMIKEGYSNCSPYYQPRSELGDGVEKILKQNKGTGLFTRIAEFQVIKVNLPKEEAEREELEISSTSLGLSKSVPGEISHSSGSQDISVDSIDVTSQDTVTNSDSESNSSSSFSSSTCSSSNCSNLSTLRTPSLNVKVKQVENSDDAGVTSGKEKQRNNEPGIQHHNDLEENIQLNLETLVIQSEGQEAQEMEPGVFDSGNIVAESSPLKMFSVTEDGNNEEETPAKNESLLEVGISETPSSSKPVTDLPVNLSLRISSHQLDQDTADGQNRKEVSSKPKILSIERVDSTICNNLEVSQILSKSQSQSCLEKISNFANDQLKNELELKRERLKTMLRDATKSKMKVKRPSITKFNRSFITKMSNSPNIKSKSNDKSKSCLLKTIKANENVSLDQDCQKSDIDLAHLEMIKSEKFEIHYEKDEETKEMLKNEKEETMKNSEICQKSSASKKVKIVKSTNTFLGEGRKENQVPMNENLDELNRIKARIDLSCIEESRETIDEQKSVMKSKVELAKRDLFSDEEVHDQRTTRSKSRQLTLDVHKSDMSDQNPSTMGNSADNSKEILEFLKLVPANKNETGDEDHEFENAADTLQPIFHHIYDESTAVKKRKRNVNQSEFLMEFQVDDESVIIRGSPLVELFNIPPEPKKRRTVRKTPVTVIKECNKAAEPNEKPLASSSPVSKAAIAQSVGRNHPYKKEDDILDEETDEDGNKVVREGDKPKVKHGKKKLKIQGLEQGNTKIKLQDPLEILNRIDVDEFLSTLHGP